MLRGVLENKLDLRKSLNVRGLSPFTEGLVDVRFIFTTNRASSEVAYICDNREVLNKLLNEEVDIQHINSNGIYSNPNNSCIKSEGALGKEEYIKVVVK
jgi:hypothetical protein